MVLTDACNWVRDYLRTNQTVAESDRHFCDQLFCMQFVIPVANALGKCQGDVKFESCCCLIFKKSKKIQHIKISFWDQGDYGKSERIFLRFKRSSSGIADLGINPVP